MKTFHFIESHVKRALFTFEQVPRIYHGADEAETQYSLPLPSYQFDVSKPVVTRVNKYIMDVCLSPFISWPTCDALHKTVPQCFTDLFGYKTSVVIDCSEIFIDRLTNLMARAQTFSN